MFLGKIKIKFGPKRYIRKVEDYFVGTNLQNMKICRDQFIKNKKDRN